MDEEKLVGRVEEDHEDNRKHRCDGQEQPTASLILESSHAKSQHPKDDSGEDQRQRHGVHIASVSPVEATALDEESSGLSTRALRPLLPAVMGRRSPIGFGR